jgi:hypothetical protein
MSKFDICRAAPIRMFEIDDAELAALGSPSEEIKAHITRARAEEFLSLPIHQGMNAFLESYQRFDLANLQGRASPA